MAAVLVTSLWPVAAGTHRGRETLSVTPRERRLQQGSAEGREAVRIIDSDDDADDRADALWAIYMAPDQDSGEVVR